MLAHGRSPAAVPEGGFAAMKAVPRQLLASALALGCLSLALFYGLSRDMYGDVHLAGALSAKEIDARPPFMPEDRPAQHVAAPSPRVAQAPKAPAPLVCDRGVLRSETLPPRCAGAAPLVEERAWDPSDPEKVALRNWPAVPLRCATDCWLLSSAPHECNEAESSASEKALEDFAARTNVATPMAQKACSGVKWVGEGGAQVPITDELDSDGAPFDCAIHLLLDDADAAASAAAAIKEEYTECLIHTWTISPQCANGCRSADDTLTVERTMCATNFSNASLEATERDAALVATMAKMAEFISRDWHSVVALLHMDCGGCEWAALPFLLAKDEALARLARLSFVAYPRRTNLSLHSLEALRDRLDLAAYSLVSCASRESLSPSTQLLVALPTLHPSRVLFNIRKAVAKNLELWSQLGGIQNEHLDALKQSQYGSKCHLVQVANRSVHVSATARSDFPEGYLAYRFFQSAILVQIAADKDPHFPDLEFWCCWDDCVAGQKPDTTSPILPSTRSTPNGGRIAAMTMVYCRDSYSIAFPIVNTGDGEGGWWTWDTIWKRIRYQSRIHPWESKREVAGFRGAVHRSCNSDADDEGAGGTIQYAPPAMCGRHELVSKYSGKPDIADVSGGHMSLSEQERTFKYAIYAHGHCQWASRLRQHLGGGRLLIKQIGVCDEFYSALLVPNIHYLPVDYHWKNLTEAVQWAKSHDREARRIVLNMNRYGDSVVGSVDVVAEYARTLLHEYHRLRKEKGLHYPLATPLSTVPHEPQY